MRILHKFKATELAAILDVFDKDMTDYLGQPYIGNSKKCEPEFFERIVSIIPIQIPHMLNKDCIRVLEVLSARNLGSERLFNNYLLMKIEKNVLKFSTSEYDRVLRALGDKQYDTDQIFWNEFILKYVYV